jgi:hypothetical protein
MYQNTKIWEVSKFKAPFIHKALLVGEMVFEISSEFPAPRWTTWAEFNRNNDATWIELKNINIPIVIGRIEKMIATGEKYNALSFNCEHAVTEALTGTRNSPQLQGIATLGLLCLVLMVAAKG